MTREKAIEQLKDLQCHCSDMNRGENVYSEWAKDIIAIDMAIESLEQEPCEDCVSRQTVFETIDDCNSDGLKGIFCSYDDGERFKEYIKKLPSVTPTQKTGEWYRQNDDYFDWYECSVCGYGSEGEMQYSSEYDVRTKYCPNCGAEMRGTE